MILAGPPERMRTLSKREGGDMADVHVMHALTAKRGELVGQMEDRRRELKQLGEELAHLEATMRLFDPQWVVDRVPVRRRAKRRQVFRGGECQRLVLEALRDAQGAISEEELVDRLVQAKGLAAQLDAVSGVRKTLLAVLRHLARQGVARSIALEDGARAWLRS
jgi:hypothetical protein